MIEELNNPLASSKIINQEADKFESSSRRRKALRKPEHSTNLFFEIEGVRYPLLYIDKVFQAGGSSFSKKSDAGNNEFNTR